MRQTLSAVLHALGTTPAVQKELLRHADIQTTLKSYTQVISEERREAATRGVVLCRGYPEMTIYVKSLY